MTALNPKDSRLAREALAAALVRYKRRLAMAAMSAGLGRYRQRSPPDRIRAEALGFVELVCASMHQRSADFSSRLAHALRQGAFAAASAAQVAPIFQLWREVLRVPFTDGEPRGGVRLLLAVLARLEARIQREVARLEGRRIDLVVLCASAGGVLGLERVLSRLGPELPATVLDAELQRRVLARFHFALRHKGYLVLGRSELIPFASKIFEPVELSLRVYRKDSRREVPLSAQERLVGLLEQENLARATEQTRDKLSALGQYDRDVLDSVPCPTMTTALDGTITSWNRFASKLWGRSESDVFGKKLAALGLPGLTGELLVEKTALERLQSANEELQTTNEELQLLWTLHLPTLKRTLLGKIRKTLAERRALRQEAISYALPTGAKGLATLVATPLLEEEINLGAVIVFEDTTRTSLLGVENRRLKEKQRR